MSYESLFLVVRGILLYGISGTGKTLLANTIARSSKRHVVEIKGWEVVNKFYGESEAKLKSFFEEAIINSPSVILIDNVETLSSSKNSSELDKRISNTLQILFDTLKYAKHKGIAVLGTTSNLSYVDANLRKPGRYVNLVSNFINFIRYIF